MQPLKRRLPVAADIAPFHQVSSKFHQPTQYPCVGRVFWPALTCNEPHSALNDPIGLAFPNGGLSGTVWLPSWRACPISLANASIAGSLSHLRVTVLCPNLAALFAIQGELRSFP